MGTNKEEGFEISIFFLSKLNKIYRKVYYDFVCLYFQNTCRCYGNYKLNGEIRTSEKEP